MSFINFYWLFIRIHTIVCFHMNVLQKNCPYFIEVLDLMLSDGSGERKKRSDKNQSILHHLLEYCSENELDMT